MTHTLRSPRPVPAASPCPVSAGRPASGRPAQRGGGLQLTRAADYAVRALIHLALQPAGARLSQVDIASAIGAPAPFVGKVMQQLASAGLVISQRGIGGGFALHPAAREATMLDAVTAIEGPLALNTCLSPDEPCERAAFCPAHDVWHDAQVRVAEVLRAATIGALAARVEPHAGTQASAGAILGHRDEAGLDVVEPRDGAARPARLYVRADDPPPRPRGREAQVAPARPRGAGPCLR